MNKYKTSKFNISHILKDGTFCIFNALSGGSVEFKSEKEFNRFKKYIKNPNIGDIPEKLKKLALKHNFILPSDIQEKDIIRVNARSLAFNTTALDLTLFITKMCNFDCVYCYQGKHNEKGKVNDGKFSDRVIKFVERNTKATAVLKVTWYGGEPLLMWDKIKSMSKELMGVCERNLCEYGAILITNGFLLTHKISSKLKELGIHKVQITLDGPPKYHNKRRPLQDGPPTFNRIVDNMYEIPEEIEINLRINVDKKNYNEALNLLPYIEDLKGRINIFFAPVTDIAFGSRDYQFCHDVGDFPDKWLELMSKALKEGFNLYYDKPTTRSSICDMRLFNTWNIDEQANIYKCPLQVWEEKYKIGYLQESGEIKVTNMPLYLDSLAYDPMNSEVCSKCRFLPMCSTHCKLSSDIYGEPIVPEKCMNWPGMLKQMLEIQHLKKNIGD